MRVAAVVASLGFGLLASGCASGPKIPAQLAYVAPADGVIVKPSPSPKPSPVPSPTPVYVAPVAPVYVPPPPPPSNGLPEATPATIGAAAADPLYAYSSPSSSSSREQLSNTSTYGSQRVFLVTQHRGEWAEVLLPSRPNGRRAWIKRSDLAERVTNLRVDVFVAAKRLVVRNYSAIVVDAPVGDGKSSTPTPTGTFYITDVTAPSDTSGPYGPRAYGTSAFSNVLDSFDGEPPQIAIHGTNQPYLIPGHVSNGCLRLTNGVVHTLMPVLELGTPVYIHP